MSELQQMNRCVAQLAAVQENILPSQEESGKINPVACPSQGPTEQT